MHKIVMMWYFMILALSFFYDGDIIPLTSQTKLLLILFVIGLGIGGLVASQQFRFRSKVDITFLPHERSDKVTWFIYCLIIYYSVLLLLLIKFVVINGGDVLVYMRVMVFSSDYEVNPFFLSDLHVFIHRILIIPSILALYIISLKNHFVFNLNKIFYISIFLLVVDSIVMFGRLNLYYMFFMYLSTLFVFSKKNSLLTFLLKRWKLRQIISITIAILVILIISSMRSLEENTSVLMSELFSSFIEYNIYGFRIFDLNLNDSTSIMHQHTYGRSFLGQIDAVFSILLRVTLDLDILPASSVNGSFLNTYFDVGNSKTKTANAFGTLFFSLFRDFGVLGILLSSIVLGFIVNWLSLKFKYVKDPKYLTLGLLFLYAISFSVYQSVFEGAFWPMFFIVIASSRYFNRNIRS